MVDLDQQVNKRISVDDYYLRIAASVAKRSTCLRRQYGAVIVKNNEIISTGYNGSARGEINCCDTGICQRAIDGSKHNDGNYANCPAVHAEMNAIISVARKDMIGSTIYLIGLENDKIIEECEPCPICKRMIKNAGIERLITIES
jgi:dCMP deaminase